MIRFSLPMIGAAALVSLSMSAAQAFAQTQVPPTDAPQSSAAPAAPAAPAPSGPPTFPAPDPANFTATAPTKDDVNSFLQANWGYDDSRMWQVQAIMKTPVDGLSKVVVFVGDKTGANKPQALGFFVLPDGKHLISGEDVLPFGAHPFADTRAKMQARADGPYRGAASKDLELVEFADMQCPHCKEAQANMDKLGVDFPNARIVFQNDPIASIHPQSVVAASYGNCVAKMGGSTAFFQFTAGVFDGQDGLSSADGATLTLNSAVTKAGLDPTKVAACASTPEVKAQVDTSVKLAAEIGVDQVPTLVVNGRSIPANAPYDTLKKIVEYQEKLDGVTTK